LVLGQLVVLTVLLLITLQLLKLFVSLVELLEIMGMDSLCMEGAEQIFKRCFGCLFEFYSQIHSCALNVKPQRRGLQDMTLRQGELLEEVVPLSLSSWEC